jgi:hypothetical protein
MKEERLLYLGNDCKKVFRGVKDCSRVEQMDNILAISMLLVILELSLVLAISVIAATNILSYQQGFSNQYNQGFSDRYNGLVVSPDGFRQSIITTDM